MDFRIGIGYDVHRFTSGRELIVGGVKIPHDLGLLGHSDADVLTHAVIDAMLGAANMGDIGILFPDNDMRYKDISSLILLEKANNTIIGAGYEIVNMDTVIISEKPKISPFRDDIAISLADCLDIDKEKISIKATTEEGLGITGDGKAMAAKAVVLLKKI